MTSVGKAVNSQNKKGKTETVSFIHPSTKAEICAPVKHREYISKAMAKAGYKPERYVVMTPELLKVIKEIANYAKLAINLAARDTGTCVMGAGIAITCFITAQKRTPEKLLLIRQPFQGNIGSHNALKPCLEWLEKNYPSLGCYWEDGNMD